MVFESGSLGAGVSSSISQPRITSLTTIGASKNFWHEIYRYLINTIYKNLIDFSWYIFSDEPQPPKYSEIFPNNN